MVEKAAGAAAQVEGGRRNLAAGETLAEVGKVAEVEAGKLFDTLDWLFHAVEGT